MGGGRTDAVVVFEFGIFDLGAGAPDWVGKDSVGESHTWHVASEGVEGSGAREGECTDGTYRVALSICAAMGQR